MKIFSRAIVGGLLWLSLSIAFGDTLYFNSQTENVEQGGQFTSDLASNPSQQLTVYCVDYLNDVAITTPATGYSVNVTDLANSTAVYNNTRYGQTPAAAFSTPVTVAASNASAQERYAMAAWLIMQYNFSAGVTTADDEIQNAIWTLLDTNGATFTANGGTGGYIAAATSWIDNAITAGTINAIENDVVIYSSTSIASTSDPARWNNGTQEMIGFTGNINNIAPSVPEPQTLGLLGIGLVTLGLLKKKIKP